MKWLLIHYFIDRWRKILDGKDLVKNIFKTFLVLLFVTYILLISLFAGYGLKKIGESGEIDPLEVFQRATFYYFLFDILVRLLFQGVSSFNINYYRSLPIKRASLIHYPLVRSGFSFFNIVPIILFLSVFIQIVVPNQSFGFSVSWIIFFISMIFANNFLGVNLKFLFQKKALFTVSLLIGFGAMLYLELEGFIDISSRYEKLVLIGFSNPITICVPIILCIAWYLIGLKNIHRLFYNDRISGNEAMSFGRFTGRNPAINLLLLELHLIIRNKRPKVTFFMSIFLIIYAAFFFIRIDVARNEVMLIFYSSIVMGVFPLQHGQFLFAWESSYFDRLMTCNTTNSDIVRSKYFLLTFFFLLGFLLMLPYNFFDTKYFLFHLGCFLFHLGVTTHLIVFSGYFNTSRMELSKGVFMNFEGVGFNQFLLVIPMALLPSGVFILGDMLGMGISAMVMVGVIGIMLSPLIFKPLVSLFNKRKLLMTESYREK